ncbi:MAG: membrane-bound lytic murein transglycosylase D, partial [Saprospiraceae bacterium]
MKKRCQFSTIFVLIVTLSACQLVPIQSSFDRLAKATTELVSGQTPDEALTNAAEVSDREKSLTKGRDTKEIPDTERANSADPEVVVAAAQLYETQDDETEDDATVVPALRADNTALDASDRDLWARIRQGLSLQHHLDEARVKAELNWYVRHPEYLDRVATRASRYLYYIVESIEQRQMPMELALLPIVESAFDPFAYSHGRASGLWQFIPGTARQYGMNIDYWHDGRRDVRQATTGALNYLERLHDRLDEDWFLALAAYNSGGGNVSSAMRKNRRASKPVDFFSLDLLKETRAYVPRLLAISAIIADPDKYGITLLSIADKPYWEMVEVGSQLDLAVAAREAEISLDELYLLNPSFNKWSTHPSGPHELLVPVNNADTLRVNLAALPVSQRLAWQRHLIKPGESLDVIARRYNTSVDSLRSANKLRGTMIRAGKSLLIPVASNTGAVYQLSEAERLKKSQRKIEQKTGKMPLVYTVRSGDSFWEIARLHDVTVRTLAKWNGMAPRDTLMPGKELKIFNQSAASASSFIDDSGSVNQLPQAQEVIRKVNYRVRQGESLARIADKFNLSVASIKQWNDGISKQKYIQPGDRITLFVDVTQT